MSARPCQLLLCIATREMGFQHDLPRSGAVNISGDRTYNLGCVVLLQGRPIKFVRLQEVPSSVTTYVVKDELRRAGLPSVGALFSQPHDSTSVLSESANVREHLQESVHGAAMYTCFTYL